MKVEVPFIEAGHIGGKEGNLRGNISNVVSYLLNLNAK